MKDFKRRKEMTRFQGFCLISNLSCWSWECDVTGITIKSRKLQTTNHASLWMIYLAHVFKLSLLLIPRQVSPNILRYSPWGTDVSYVKICRDNSFWDSFHYAWTKSLSDMSSTVSVSETVMHSREGCVIHWSYYIQNSVLIAHSNAQIWNNSRICTEYPLNKTSQMHEAKSHGVWNEDYKVQNL